MTDLASVPAAVTAAPGIGAVAGGLAVTALGDTSNRGITVVIAIVFAGVFNQAVIGLYLAAWVWVIAAAIGTFAFPFVNGSNMAIWLRRVDPAEHGKALGAFFFLAQLSVPMAMVTTGYLADLVFEPWFENDEAFGSAAFGSGEGAGLGALLTILGALSVVAVLLLRRPLTWDGAARGGADRLDGGGVSG